MGMGLKTLITCVLCMLAASLPCETKAPELQTAPHAEARRYAGTWYEIARLPHWFEKGLIGTTATYETLQGGRVLITIRGYRDDFDGNAECRKFVARIDDEKNSKYVVKLFWFFNRTYYILEAGEDFGYLVVGNRSRDNLWILCRRPCMSSRFYGKLLKRIKENGFDVSAIEQTRQRP